MGNVNFKVPIGYPQGGGEYTERHIVGDSRQVGSKNVMHTPTF